MELIDAWLPSQPWASVAPGPPGGTAAIDVAGAYRFDDPEGQVGMEAHLVRRDGVLLHVPLTYRDAPLPEAAERLVGTMQHSALGERWVYDGLGDPVFVRMLAAVAMTGAGQSVGMVSFRDRWVLVPSNVRLTGGGWSDDRVPLDGFSSISTSVDPSDSHWAVLANDRFTLRVARRPVPGSQPPMGLTATFPGQNSPVVLAEVVETAG